MLLQEPWPPLRPPSCRLFGHKSDRRRVRQNEHLACAGRSDGLESFRCTRSVVLGPVVPWYHPQAMWQQQRGRAGAAHTVMTGHKLVSGAHN